MTSQYKHIGLTVKSDLEAKSDTVKRITSLLCRLEAQVYIDSERIDASACSTSPHTLTTDSPLDLMIVVGGDGTILRAVRQLPHLSVPILSIHRGTVGFLAEVPPHELEEWVPSMLRGEAMHDERRVLEVYIEREGEVIESGIALNEAVVGQKSIARLLNVSTSIDAESLTTFNADGLIIATPTGSTAYSLAAGGPIVHPQLAATILTPINPHSFSQKPVVLPASSQISVFIEDGDDVVVTLDGQRTLRLQGTDTVHAHLHKERLTFLRRKEDTFFATLRQKLQWGARTDELNG